MTDGHDIVEYRKDCKLSYTGKLFFAWILDNFSDVLLGDCCVVTYKHVKITNGALSTDVSEARKVTKSSPLGAISFLPNIFVLALTMTLKRKVDSARPKREHLTSDFSQRQ